MRLLVIFALLFLLAGCRPPESPAAGSRGVVTSDGVTVTMQIEGEPVVGEAPVRVEVERDGEAVANATVEVVGEMTHAGMEPVLVEATQVEPGLYRAEEFAFNMAGDWIVSAEVSLDDGEQLRATRALSVEQR